MKDIVISRTTDDLWIFGGTQLKVALISRTADDLWIFGGTH